MLYDGLPIASSGYSAKLETFNLKVLSTFSQLTSNLKSKEPLLYAYYEMLLEAQGLGHLAENIVELTHEKKYLEALTVARGLFERTLNFKAASNFELQIVFQRAQSLDAGCRIVDSNPLYKFHNCATTTSEMNEVCLEFRIPKDAPHRSPMTRYYISKSSNMLAHDFPSDYRQVLWSFVDEENLVASNQWLRRHYTSFESVVKNLSAIGILGRPDKAKILSHYGFLSAIAHAPFGIVSELHGHNRSQGSFYGPTNRLLHLYVSSCLLLILESLLPWMLDYDYFEQSKIDEINNLLKSRGVILSELSFPFAPDHNFDNWQRSLPRLALKDIGNERYDLSKEFLDPDYLARIFNINTPTTEFSVGKTWVPMNLFGIDS